MSGSRLTQALEQGAVVLPESGLIAILDPPQDFDLSGLEKNRVTIRSRFRPDFDAWNMRGYAVGTEIPEAAAAILCIPRAKAAAQAQLAEVVTALPEGAPVLVDGQKTDGVDSVLKLLKRHVDLGASYSKAHGKIAAFSAQALPDDWHQATKSREGYTTAPGVFSADGIDPGSAALCAALPLLKGRVCDLGAGWGYLSATTLSANSSVRSMDLVEADLSALEAAKANISDPRATFHWADATTFTSPAPYDVILSNPPFHTGRKADPGLGRAFIAAAARLLSRSGTFFVVANRHLPYEATLNDAFGQVEELHGPASFKLIAARKPRQR